MLKIYSNTKITSEYPNRANIPYIILHIVCQNNVATILSLHEVTIRFIQYPSIKGSRKVNIVYPQYACYIALFHTKFLCDQFVVLCVYQYDITGKLIVTPFMANVANMQHFKNSLIISRMLQIWNQDTQIQIFDKITHCEDDLV